MGNSTYWGKYRREIAEEIAKYIPAEWRLDLQDVPGDPAVDAVIRITGPDGSRADVALEFKPNLPPSIARTALLQLRESQLREHLLVAPYISPHSQRFLRERGASYLDLSGNAHWALRSPALYISSTSAKQRSPKKTPGRTLRGPKAGRLIREICDRRPPFTVTSLARELLIDYGNVSRYLDLLQRDALITREPRGPVTSVDWEGVLRRWSEDYRRPAPVRYFDPRGLDHFQRIIASADIAYAFSGIAAASAYAPYTVPNAVLCYCDDPEVLARKLELKRGDRHTNVILSMPFDEAVYSRTRIVDHTVVVAPTQAAVDLLIGQGRELDQAEALIQWMKEHEDDWRV